MPKLTLQEIVETVSGKILNNQAGKTAQTFSHFHFDTRLIEEPNTLFFALKSDSNDGHRFVPHLENKKDTAAVVSDNFEHKGINVPLIQVEDPLKAAHSLAAYVRKKWAEIKYVGITGSAGKTTTKEFVYQITSRKSKTFRSFKNWNNWIGLPFSLLNMVGDETIAVFELAMSYPGIGEIDLLAEILRPDVAVILNVFPVHLEFLKNLDNVASAKSEILNYLDADGIAFITGDSYHIIDQARLKKGRKVYFGKNDKNNNIILREVIRDDKTTRMVIEFFGIDAEFSTNIINGIHIENLFTAIIVAQHLGFKNRAIQEALTKIHPLAGRGEIKELPDFTIIDETYNSNPEALKKTLDWVDREFSGFKIAALGDMLELGDEEADFHRQVGKHFAGLNYDLLVTVGSRAKHIAQGAQAMGYTPDKVKCFKDAEEAGRFLSENVRSGSIILFKASRGIQLEKAMAALEKIPAQEKDD